MKNTEKKPRVRVKKVTNIDGYDVGHLNMSVQSIQDKTGRVEYVLFATLYAKNNTDKVYDEKDEVMDISKLTKEEIDGARMEKIGFQVPLINENKDFRDRIVHLMEEALRLKIEHREKINNKKDDKEN